MHTRNRRAVARTSMAVAIAATALVGAHSAASAQHLDATTTPAGDCAGPLAEPSRLTISAQPNVNASPLYLAVARGYFADENITVEVTNTGTSAETQPLLATGRLDAMYAGPSAGFFNGLADGQQVRFAAGSGQYRPGGFASAFVTRPDSGITSVADLEGKKVSVAGGIPAVSGFYLAELLKQADLTVDDVEIVLLGVPDGLVALANGSVDAAISSGPLMTAGIADGSQVVVGDMDVVLQEGNSGGFIFGPTLLEANRCAGVAVLRSLLKAVRVDLQGDYLEDPEIVTILATAMDFPEEVIAATPPPLFDDNLATTPDVYQNMQTFWREQDVLSYDTDLALAQIVDEDVMQQALATYTA